MPSVKVPTVRSRPPEGPPVSAPGPHLLPHGPRPPRRTAPGRPTAVALALVLSLPAGAGCEYTYDDAGSAPEAAVSSAPAAVEPQVRRRGPPAIPAEEMAAWMLEAMPAASGEVVHSGLARLEGGEVRIEETATLVAGTYSLTMACRSVRRLDVLVRNGTSAVIDLRLLCGPARVSVLQLPNEAVLSLRVQAGADANVAYRLNRL